MGFWANVEREREYQGLSRKELAFKANIAYQGIGLGLERNSMPGADTAVKISKVLQVPIEYLIGEDFIDTRDAETAKATDDELKIKNIEMYKRNQQVLESLEKLPLAVKEPIVNMIVRIADGLEA